MINVADLFHYSGERQVLKYCESDIPIQTREDLRPISRCQVDFGFVIAYTLEFAEYFLVTMNELSATGFVEAFLIHKVLLVHTYSVISHSEPVLRNRYQYFFFL